MAQLPLPPQLSTDPGVNASAMAWAAQLTDELSKRFNGSVLASALPGQQLTYDQITTNVTVAATTEAGATTIITATAFTFDGTTAVTFEFFAARIITSANAGDDVTIYLFEDGVIVGIIGQLVNPGAAGLGVPVVCRLRKTPSAGAHTYSVRAKRTTANGTVLAGTGGTGTFLPAFLRISKA